MKIIATLLSLFFFCINSYGQSNVLDEYIEYGLENNLALRGSQLDLQIQQANIDQATKLWNPTLDLNASYLLATGGRKILFPIGDLFNPTYSTLNQLTGTSQFPTDLENVETQLTPNNFVDAQLNAAKPIINSAIKYNIKIQEQLLHLSSLDQKLIRQDLILQIKTAYYNYLKSFQGIRTIDESIEFLKELRSFNETLVRYDKATSDVISDVQYRIDDLESQKTGILEQQNLAKALFNLLLNRPMGEDVIADDEIINAYQQLDQNISTLKEEAINQRIEIEQLSTSEEINQLNQSRIQKEQNPTVALFGGIGIQTEDFSRDDGGPLYTAGVSLSMNIIDGGIRKKKLEQLQFELEKIQNQKEQVDQQIEIEITTVWYQLKTIESQITSQLSALRSAEESFGILQTKYENEKLLLIELLQAQNRITLSKIKLEILKYDHLIKQADLDKALANAK